MISQFEVKVKFKFKVKVKGQVKDVINWHGVVLSGTWLCKVQQNIKQKSGIWVRYTLKNIIECSSQGLFKMLGRSKCLFFRLVARLWLVTLLIRKEA